MVVASAPQPSYSLPPFLSSRVPRERERLSRRVPLKIRQAVRQTWRYAIKKFEQEGIVPLLTSEHIDQQAFTDALGKYMRLSSLFIATLEDSIDSDSLLELAVRSLHDQTILVNEQGPTKLSHEAFRSFLAGLDTVSLLYRDFVQFTREKTPFSVEETHSVASVAGWLAAFGLCSYGVLYYLTVTDDPAWISNANQLARWGFDYSQLAAVEWGYAQRDRQRYRPVREVMQSLP